MPQMFTGRWKLSVIAKNAGFAHRVRVTGATIGNGTYQSAPGTAALIDGSGWSVFLEWNDGAGSGWQESAVLRAEGFPTPITRTIELRADDNFPAQRDNDFDDLVVLAEFQEAPFDVVRRPAAINRSTLTLYPDGIFDAGQGMCFMAVRVRATFVRAWSGAAGVRIGIGAQSRSQLASSGILPIDAWSAAEQEAFGQRVEPDGFVQTGPMAPGDERTLYFKLDVSGAPPSKPEIGFVARAAVPNVAYEAPGRVVRRQIFVSRSTYNPVTRELHARLPEGDLFMRLNRVMGDSAALQQTLTAALAGGCRRAPPSIGQARQDSSAALAEYLRRVVTGQKLDACDLRDLILDCRCAGGECDKPGRPDRPDDGERGPGSDDWCRYKPFAWLPVEFEYRLVPSPPYAGQFGPLAFDDPWWKVILIVLAVLLAAASVVYDYIYAGQDSNFVIGTIAAKSARATSNVDAATALLNGSRGRDLGTLDAQGDDRNNGLPIDGTVGGTLAIDRTDNGDRGILDATAGNVVFKSGARSGTTRGTVSSVSTSVPVDGVTFSNQVIVLPLPAPDNQPLSQGGDSGSLWIDLAAMRPVALNFAGPTSDDGSRSIANPIREVVALLDLHFNT